MGKRKIEIKRVEECKRNVTFSKRKTGLFSKASTACDKFGSEIAIILFSPAGKPYVFGPVDSLIDQFLHHHQSSSSSSLIPHPNFPNFVSGTNSDACGTTTDHDHIEGEKKRSRSCRDDNGDDLIAEREMKKRKFLSTEEAVAEEEEEEKEGFLLTSCETEEGLMKNGFMGHVADDCCSSLLISTEAAAAEGAEKEGFLLTSSETEEGLMKNGLMGVVGDCYSSLLMSTEAAAAAAAVEQEKEGFLLTSNETEEGLMKNGFMGAVADDCCCSSLLMSTEAAAVEGEEKEGFLLTSSETEEGLMKNGFMGGGADDCCCSSSSPFPPVDSSLVSDDELNETLMVFADYIAAFIADHEETLFDLLPHQGVCDEDAFPFSDNWATIDVQDQPLS